MGGKRRGTQWALVEAVVGWGRRADKGAWYSTLFDIRFLEMRKRKRRTAGETTNKSPQTITLWTAVDKGSYGFGGKGGAMFLSLEPMHYRGLAHWTDDPLGLTPPYNGR